MPRKQPKSKRTKYDPDVHPRWAESLARHGARVIDIAADFGVSKRTVVQWKHDHKKFSEALLRGRDDFDSNKVESALLRKALGYDYEEVHVETVTVAGEDADGKKIKVPATKVRKVNKHVQSDITAMIFWLVNRWRQRKDPRWVNLHQMVKVEAEHKHTHEDRDAKAFLGLFSVKELERLRDRVVQMSEDEGGIGESGAATKGGRFHLAGRN